MTLPFMSRILYCPLRSIFRPHLRKMPMTQCDGKTSEIAESAGALLAINGGYYGAQEDGYVLRNGVLYRNTAASGQVGLVIDL